MKSYFLLIFAGFIFQSYQQLQVEVFNRLFGDGEIRDPEHIQISESHVCSSMDDLLQLCKYEKSIQEEISRLPKSQLKANYYQHLRTDVINQFPNNTCNVNRLSFLKLFFSEVIRMHLNIS